MTLILSDRIKINPVKTSFILHYYNSPKFKYFSYKTFMLKNEQPTT